MNDKVLNMTMPSELYEKLQEEAKSNDYLNKLKQEEAKKKSISLAALVRMICSEYLNK